MFFCYRKENILYLPEKYDIVSAQVDTSKENSLKTIYALSFHVHSVNMKLRELCVCFVPLYILVSLLVKTVLIKLYHNINDIFFSSVYIEYVACLFIISHF